MCNYATEFMQRKIDRDDVLASRKYVLEDCGFSDEQIISLFYLNESDENIADLFPRVALLRYVTLLNVYPYVLVN